MFEKLISLLPYNPGLASQLAFYSRRMRQEAAIRRTGLAFLTLAFLVQFLAVLNPPQPTLANDDNSLISGGFSLRSEAYNDCIQNVRHYGDIIHAYGLKCKDMLTADTVTIHSHSENGNYYSMGWVRQGPTNAATGKPTGEQPVNLPGVGTLYWRHLSSFDSFAGDGKPYEALRMHNSEGRRFYILKSCGNLTTVGLPSPIETVSMSPPTAALPPTTTTTPTPPPSTPLPPKPAVCPYNALLPASDINCKPCDQSVSSLDTVACITVHKTATNITTAEHTDANGTTVQPGSVILYTLSAANSGKADVKDFVFEESLSDVLDYADVTDLHGGTMDAYHTVSWPAETIPAGQTASHQITIKVKDPIPSTPADPNDPAHFDLTMTNVYGDTVNIKVPAPPVKQVQTATASLPNTGPGASLALAVLVVIVAGYFYSRASLLSRESALALKETNS